MTTRDFIVEQIREAAAGLGEISDHELQVTQVDITALPYNWDLIPAEDGFLTPGGTERAQAIQAAVEVVRKEHPRIDW